jgi:hypothetical protein
MGKLLSNILPPRCRDFFKNGIVVPLVAAAPPIPFDVRQAGAT